MSLGGNFSSGQTQKLMDSVNRYTSLSVNTGVCIPCNSTVPGPSPVTVYPSMLLAGRTPAAISPAEFASYAKIAPPSSVRTQSLMTQTSSDPSQRFSQYQRYQPPTPCPPLPPSMAGISLPSTRKCNL